MYGLRWQSFPLPTAGEIAGLVAPLGLPKGDVATPLLTRGCAAVAPLLLRPPPGLGYTSALVTPMIASVSPDRAIVGDVEARVLRTDGTIGVLKLSGVTLEGREAVAVLARRLSGATSRHPTEPETPLLTTRTPPDAGWMSKLLSDAARRAVDGGGRLAFPVAVRLRVSDGDTEDGATVLRAWVGNCGYGVASAPSPGDVANALSAMQPYSLPPGHPLRTAGADIRPDGVWRLLSDVAGGLLFRGRTAVEKDAARAFWATLDRRATDTIAALGWAERCSVGDYQWLAAGGDERRQGMRRQAASAYPALVRHAALYPGAGVVDAAIDAGCPLEPVLAGWGTLPPAVVRSLRSVPSDALGSVPEDVKTALSLLSKVAPHLPLGHWPREDGAPIEQQWRCLVATLRFAEAMRRRSDWEPDLREPDLGRYVARQSPFWRTNPARHLDRIGLGASAVFMVGDMANSFATQILAPLAIDATRAAGLSDPEWHDIHKLTLHATAGMESLVCLSLVRDRSLLRLLDLSDDWHERQDAIQAEIVRATDTRGWPALVPLSTWPTSNGALSLVPLTTAADLADEGARLRHCVGSYVNRCIYEGVHIFSVRDAEGRSLSTIEVEATPPYNGRPHRFEIIQNYGHHNDAPAPAAKEVARQFLATLRSGRLNVDWESLAAPAEARKADSGDLEASIGYDPDSAEGRDAALAAWAFALPRDERGLSHADWAERLGLPAHLDAMLAAPAPVAAWGGRH